LTGSSTRDDANEPVAHDSDAISTRKKPSGSESPPPPGRSRRATPQKPKTTPTSVTRATRSPDARRINTTQTGTIATISAASPEAIDCSATITRPLPPAASAMPQNAAHAAWRPVTDASTERSTRIRTTASMTSPAMRNRAPPLSIAGRSSTTTRMAR
jgi:hypothetical protein